MSTEKTAARRYRVGFLGCGNIFGRYVAGLERFPEFDLAFVSDVDLGRAEVAAGEHGIPAWGSVESMLADPSIDIVINLTPPRFHADTTIAALDAGKNVYLEKPLSITFTEAQRVHEAAQRSPGVLGVAPDTFLGSAVRTARAVLDEGLLGEIIGASAFITHSKAERWHPDPRFLFTEGGGPGLDMGPYYVSILVHLLGAVSSVAGVALIGEKTRTVTAPDRVIDQIKVEVPTHSSATLQFRRGAVATLMMSFDVWDSSLPYIEIYGTQGTLSLPNPNHFDGDVRLRHRADDEWVTLPMVGELFGAVGTKEQARRGLGVRDLADALEGGEHRTNADLALHVLEVLDAVEESSLRHVFVDLTTTYPTQDR